MASQGNNYSEKGAYRYNESSSSGATFAHPVKTNSESSNTRHESVVMVESAPATQRTVVSQGYGIQEHLATVGSPYDHQAPPPNQRRRHYKKRSYVWTAGVILVCSIVFVVEMFVNNCPKHERDNAGNQASQRCIVRFLGRLSFQPLKENPLFGPSTSALKDMGALSGNLIRKSGEFWRLLTCMWLHAGVIHLICNMYGIWFIGLPLEHDFGFFKVAAIYLLSGFGGSLLSALFIRGNLVSVGASGALFGLVGAALSELIINWSRYTNRLCVLVNLLFVIILNLMLGLLPYVDNFGHLGGLICGFLLGFVLLLKPQWAWEEQVTAVNLGPQGAPFVQRNVQMHSKSQKILRIVAIVLFLAGYISTISVVFSKVDGNKGCSWCHYLTCVPTSLWTCPDESTNSPGSQVVCKLFTNNDGSGSLVCADQRSNPLTNVSSLSSEDLKKLCSSLCG